MKNEKLFEAIGGLDDAMLAETEAVDRRSAGRTLRRTVLVAALVAGMAISAGAAPLIRNALRGGEVEKDERPWFSATNPSNGASYESRSYEITLDVDIDENAPNQIETFYLPQMLEDAPQRSGNLYNGSLAQYGWYSDEMDQGFFFSQQAGGSIRKEDLTYSVHVAPDDQPKTELRMFGGVEGYYVAAKPIGEGEGERWFFWSDGDYLFYLEVPYEYTDIQLEEIVASVKQIDDIMPYLPDLN